jgi:SAM-dependent methyltransferase
MSGSKLGRMIAAYESIARRYAAEAGDNAYNAHYERPALLSLLPRIEGRRILDAGCGPGFYAAELLARGAEVVAVDASPAMVRLARDRLGGSTEIRLADLTQPLDFLADGAVDGIVSALVFDSIEDWHRLFAEFRRVLSRDGVLVFSAGHPMTEYALSPSGRYFDVEAVEAEWPSYGITVPSFRRSLQAMLDPLTANGFRIDRILEPRPAEAVRGRWPQVFEKLSLRPQFICIRATAG